MNKIVVITGANTGIGKCTADMLRSKGDTVLSLSLAIDEEYPEFSYICDVADESRVKDVISEIGQKYGHIDILINCAGYGLNGVLELLTPERIKKQFEVNVFGLVSCTNHALSFMGKGSRIINISSAMALFPVPYRSMYGASKSAVLSLSFAQRMELKACKSGIDVCAVCPGDVNTNFTKNKEIVVETNERYGDRIKNAFAKFDDPKRKEKQIKPEKVAKKLVKLCYAKKTRPMVIIGGKMKLLHFVTRFTSKNTLLNATMKVCG